MNILAVNSGSSSLKASLFLSNVERRNFIYRDAGQGGQAFFTDALSNLIHDLNGVKVDIIGHRFVHGGGIGDAARLVDSHERKRLNDIVHMAPLHLPNNLLGLDICQAAFRVPQVACFDTAFHATLPEIAYRLPIPAQLHLRRYGFHGLNYAHIAQQLPRLIGGLAKGRVVVAHLGNGASLCVMENLRSIDTTMGYTPAGGIPMATRSGDIDPGVMLALARQFDVEALSKLVYQEMGLLALSEGESSDMKVLVKSDSERAKFAVQFFAHQVRGAIGSFAAKYGALDALIFTGGIGENCAAIRELICEPLAFLGFTINKKANVSNAVMLNASASKPIWMISADEESEIARLASCACALS